MKHDDESLEALAIIFGMLFLMTCIGLVASVVIAVAKLFGTGI